MPLTMNTQLTRTNRETGAVLLSFMLIIIVGSTYFLVTKLNTNARIATGEVETRAALNLAKQALIGYAISYPEKVNSNFGPGYLPCPDRDNNGIVGIGLPGGGSCSLNGNTSIGRFPYRTLDAEDLRDNHGERLWYVVSDNFRHNPKLIPLNSETAGNSSGDMTVDGYANIAAVIFATDAPENSQNRTAANENSYAHYIEATFTDSDSDSIIDSVTTADTDRYILLTKDELMNAVEKRVLGEAKLILTDYFNDRGAYPWLTPFADPKTAKAPLSGEHDGGDNVATLSDSSRDFTEWGVSNGDTVRNITDGSIGTVTAVAATSLTIAGGLSLGTENDFDDDDEYYIYPAALSSKLTGSATNANDSGSLKDATNDFSELDIAPGDIVDNLTDGSSGVVDTVSTNELTFLSLTGGAENDFDTNDVYKIRSHQGQATTDTDANGLTLEDTNNDFVVMGVQVSDLIVNLTDGSISRVSAVVANTITVDELYFGSDNSFEANDYYSLPRYNTDNATREGLLSFHEVGEYFSTGYSLDWDITQANGAVRGITINTPSADALYTTALESHIEGALTVDIDIEDGQCIWATEEIIECKGINKGNFLQGTTTSGSNSVFLIDSTKNFNTYGIKAGDVIQNYDDTLGITASGTATAGSGELLLVDTTRDFSPLDPAALYNFVVTKNNNLNEIAVIAEIIAGPNAGESNTLRLIPSPTDTNLSFSAGDPWEVRQPQRLVVNSVPTNSEIYTVQTTATIPDMDASEYYRILTATGSISGTADGASSGTFLEDSSADFSNIQVGDIVENTNDDGIGIITFGRITSVPSSTTLTAQLYLPTNPSTSTIGDFDVNENYVIHYDYVGARQYDLETRYSGVAYVHGVNNVRKRNVCIGYEDVSSNPDCSPTATTQATTLPPNVDIIGNDIVTVTITDLLDITENTASTATITIDGSSSGSMRLSDLDYYLRKTNGEIPDWFVKNNWHQLIYVAYSSGYTPGGSGSCTAGTDCLTLEQTDGTNILANNAVRAMVFIAGEETQTTRNSACGVVAAVDQVRSDATINEYFELKNCDSGDDEFQQVNLPTTLNFNDQLKIIN